MIDNAALLERYWNVIGTLLATLLETLLEWKLLYVRENLPIQEANGFNTLQMLMREDLELDEGDGGD